MRLTFLNAFQFCKCLRYAGHVMVLVVAALVGLTYYVVMASSMSTVLQGGIWGFLSALALLIFNGMVVMLCWAYAVTLFTNPGGVPHGWHPFADDEEAVFVKSHLPRVQNCFDAYDPRQPRFCGKCNCWKPERAHHCSMTGRCVLKMDHYCIWVVNTVGLLNYKAFLLFIGYTLLACVLAVALLARPALLFLLESPTAVSPAVFMAFVLDAAFVISLLGFTVLHVSMIAANTTSIEMFESQRLKPWPYDRGFRRNFEEVFGRRPARWWLPHYAKDETAAMLEQALQPRLANFTTEMLEDGLGEP